MSTSKTKICKTIGVIALISSLQSCEKDKVDPEPLIREIQVVAPKSALVGRWRLIKWHNFYFNTVDCSNVYSTLSHADGQGIDFEFEVNSDGAVRNYRNDTLVETFFITDVITDSPNYLQYHVNDSERSFQFISLENSYQIGDTLNTWNPTLNLNSYSGGNIWYMMGMQYFVKVE